MMPLAATSAIAPNATVALSEPNLSVEWTMISTGPRMPSIMWSANQKRVVPTSRSGRQRLRSGYRNRSSIATPPATPIQ